MDIVDHSTSCGVNIKYIVKRIIAHVPEEVIADLKTVEIFDFAPGRKGFARYVRHENKIDLYVHEDIGWLPWILKKTFIFPYLLVGLALGHEIDHHVNRDRVMTEEDREKFCGIKRNEVHLSFIWRPKASRQTCKMAHRKKHEKGESKFNGPGSRRQRRV